MAGIRPLPGYVLIEPIEEEEKSAGGVYLPESSKDKPMKGKVIGVSDYKEKVIDNGQVVVIPWESVFLNKPIVAYKKWTNQEISHEGKEYLLVKFDELLAVIE